MIIVAVKDRAIQAFLPALAQLTVGEALRNFKSEIDKPDSQIAKYPTDYEIWQLAEYDHETGEVTPELKLLARAEDLKKGE